MDAPDRLRGQASMCCSTPPTGCNGNGVGREGVVGRVAANAVRTPSAGFPRRDGQPRELDMRAGTPQIAPKASSGECATSQRGTPMGYRGAGRHGPVLDAGRLRPSRGEQPRPANWSVQALRHLGHLGSRALKARACRRHEAAGLWRGRQEFLGWVWPQDAAVPMRPTTSPCVASTRIYVLLDRRRPAWDQAHNKPVPLVTGSTIKNGATDWGSMRINPCGCASLGSPLRTRLRLVIYEILRPCADRPATCL